MAEIDREKQKRDEQISLFVRKTLTDLLPRLGSSEDGYEVASIIRAN
jgi:hypothetical protein